MIWMNALSFVWKFKTLIGAGLLILIILGLYARADHLSGKLAATERDRKAAIEVATKNAAAAKAIAKERDETVALLNAVRAEDAKRNQLVTDILKEVNNAPAATCPASDRLNAAHRGLRALVGSD